MKAEYIAGDISYRELAAKYGVPFGTLRKVAAREQWAQKRAQARTKADTILINKVGAAEGKKASDIIDVADKLLDKITELIETAPLESQAIRQLTSALKDLREIKGIKTEADIREQNARIKNLERQIAADGAESKPITIVLAGDTDKYSK